MIRGIKAPATKELIEWVNKTLQENYSNFPHVQNVEKLGTGVVYCYLLNLIHPEAVKLTKLNHKAKRQDENIVNLKMLSIAFQKLKIQKALEIDRLARMKTLDNLELTQWFYKYYASHERDIMQNRRLSLTKGNFEKKAPTKNDKNFTMKEEKYQSHSPETSNECEQNQQVVKKPMPSKKKQYLGDPTDNKFQQKLKQNDAEIPQSIKYLDQLEENYQQVIGFGKMKTTFVKEPSILSQIKTVAQSKQQADDIKMRKIQKILFGKSITKTHEKSIVNSMFNNVDQSTSKKTNFDLTETKLQKVIFKTAEVNKKEQTKDMSSSRNVSPINFNKSYMDNRYLIRESMAPKTTGGIARGLAAQMHNTDSHNMVNIFSQKYPGTPTSKTPTPSFSKISGLVSRNQNNLNRGNCKEENLLENTPKVNNNSSYLLSSQKLDQEKKEEELLNRQSLLQPAQYVRKSMDMEKCQSQLKIQYELEKQ